MHDHHRFDPVRVVGAEPRFDRARIDRPAPVARDEVGAQTEAFGDLAPEHGELAGLEHQHRIARRERVADRRFPRAASRRGVDHDLAGARAEDALQAGDDLLREPGERGASVVDRRHVDCAQHTLRNV